QYGGDKIETFTYDLAGNPKSQILRTAGFVKLVRVADGPVVGVHMVGARVGELVGEAQLIYNWEAYPAELAQLVHMHPTQNEALGEGALGLARQRSHVERWRLHRQPQATKESDGGGVSVTLPALGESVTEGTVTRWLKQVGDTVETDEPLLEVSTDK